MPFTLVLASQSPRRQELLAQLGYQFICQGADLDESIKPNEQPADYVVRLAQEKALEVLATLKKQTLEQAVATNYLVLGSDTAVVFEHNILGKPADFADCQRMLSLLSGNKHQVYTAIALVSEGKVSIKTIVTDVYFKALSEREIANYWQTGEPQDKAGSYGIQGIAGQFIEKIVGSYSSVVGLPLFETTELLNEHGLPSAMQME